MRDTARAYPRHFSPRRRRRTCRKLILPKDMDSKFRFITVAAQRAKQIQNGAKPRVEAKSRKPTRIAIEEVLAKAVSWEMREEPTAPVPADRASPGGGPRRPPIRHDGGPRRHRVHRGLQGLRGPARAAEAGRGRPRRDDEAATRFVAPMTFEALSQPPGLPGPVGAGGGERHPAHLPGGRRGPPAGGARHRQHPGQVRPGDRGRRALHAVPRHEGARAGGPRHERQHVPAPGGGREPGDPAARGASGSSSRGPGYLACGWLGKGRLAEVPEIVAAAMAVLSAAATWRARTVLVTAGPTVEDIDPVRFVSNRSSGRMGYRLAEAARDRGARVVLVRGPTSLPAPAGVEIVPVRSAQEMAARGRSAAHGGDGGGDGRRGLRLPAGGRWRRRRSRRARGRSPCRWSARRTSCATLGQAGRPAPGGLRGGDRQRARERAGEAAREAPRPDRGQRRRRGGTRASRPTTNAAVLIDARGARTELPRMGKRELAERIWDRVIDAAGAQPAGSPPGRGRSWAALSVTARTCSADLRERARYYAGLTSLGLPPSKPCRRLRRPSPSAAVADASTRLAQR